MQEKFAFESDEISIAFVLNYGLGDCIIAKRVFDALVKIVPLCRIDIFFMAERHKIFAKAFYGNENNLNQILSYNEIFNQNVRKYDLAIQVAASFAIFLEHVNTQRIQAMSPALLQSIIKINEYNKKNVYGINPWGTALASRQILISRVFNRNFAWCLSCNGALPIQSDNANISLLPEYQSEFDKLRLDNYITIYSNISKNNPNKLKNKTWPIYHLREYVARMKKRFPQIEIVQCGGGGDIKIENVDRHFLGCDLELTKYILANSLLHVGCEGGLIHLATALGTKCLVLFGPSDKHFFGYDQNINIVSDVCYPCMYILSDYSLCLRALKEPICMTSISPQLVCEITCTYLRHLL